MTIYNGDAIACMENIETASIDAIITDPPYGTTACKWDAVIPFGPMWEQIRRISKPTTPTVLFCSQPFTSALIASNFKDFRYTWVWEKERPTNVFSMKLRPGKVHEDIAVFYQKAGQYFPQMEERKAGRGKTTTDRDLLKCNNNGTETTGKTKYKYSKDYNPSLRYPRSVRQVNRDGKKLHPTQKPLELIRYLVKTYTKPGELVLDFTMGSGTTWLACEQLGRRFIGIEQEFDWIEVARDRVRQSRQEHYEGLRNAFIRNSVG
jgi:site-specific DNA-methyltransferase (adenine-specific)